MANNHFDPRKSQIEFSKLQADEKSVEMKNLKQKEKMEKLLEQKAKLEATIADKQKKVAETADTNFKAKRRIPEQIVNTDPEFFGNRKLAKSYVEPVSEALENIEDLDTITPERLGTLLRETRDEKIKYGQGGEINNFNKELSKGVDLKLKEIDPDYAAGMLQSADTRRPQELLSENGVLYNKKLEEVTFNDSSRSKLNRVLVDPKANSQSYKQIKEALEESVRLGYLPKGTNVESLLHNQKLSALKNDISRLKQGGDLNAFDINSMAKGELSRTPGIATKLGGTRLQEFYALMKGSKGFQKVAKLGKYGGLAGGIIGGGMSAAQAAEDGSLSGPAALVAGTAEAFNPTPLDIVEGSVQASAAAKDTVANTDRELLMAQPEMNADVMGSSDLVLQNPVVQSALKGFAKGSVSAIPSLVNSAKEGLDSFGKSQSNDARSRMEQNMKASAPHEEFKSFVEQKPEQVQELAQYFSGDEKTSAFVAPLEKAASGDERTRSAVLFGLYQQPAFRQAMKARKGM